MAQWLWNRLGNGDWQAVSAGSKPAGYVHPLAIKAMSELDEDLTDARSKHVDEFVDQAIDLVVTVCDNAAESCPTFAGAVETLHWPFDDPADATGTEEEQMLTFRRVRDEIKDKIAGYVGN